MFLSIGVNTVIAAMSETEKLIDLVRERSFLYDMNDPEYKNRPKRLATWKEIASEMGSGNADIWLARWKGLKDNFVKFKKSSEPAHADTYKNYKHWLWADKLMFLDDCFSSRRIPKYRPKHRGETHDLKQTVSNFDLDTPAENLTISDSLIDQTNKSEQEEQDRAEETSVDDDQENHSIKKDNEDSSEDGVEHFFLSYAQSFKKLPIKMQIMLKLDIATLFSRYELQADGVTPESIDNIPRVVPHPVKREFDVTNFIDD